MMNNCKSVVFFLFILHLLSCKGGDITKEDIYVQEPGGLVSAQGYVFKIPASGGVNVLQIVSQGIWKVQVIGLPPSGCFAVFDDRTRRNPYDTVSFLYDDNRIGYYKRYLEEVIVYFRKKEHSIERLTFRIHTFGRDGHIADIVAIRELD